MTVGSHHTHRGQGRRDGEPQQMRLDIILRTYIARHDSLESAYLFLWVGYACRERQTDISILS